MIRRLVPRGLRGRLMAAFVVTSALTLVVAATVLYGPLRDKLRTQSVDNLRDAVVNAEGVFADALGDSIEPSAAEHARDTGADGDHEPAQRDQPARVRPAPADRRARHGRRPGRRRDVAARPSSTTPTSRRSPHDATLAALQAEREDSAIVRIAGDEVTVAVPLQRPDGPRGVLVAQRRLTEVTAAV